MTKAAGDAEIKLLRKIYLCVDQERLIAENPELTTDTVLEFFRRLRELLEAAHAPAVPERPAAPRKTRKKSPVASAVLYADGGSRGNPGPAGYGFVLLAADGETLSEGWDSIGVATNNVAEYRGVIAGLERALELGIRDITLRSDSELLVLQIKGTYRVKSPKLKPLHARARDLLAEFANSRVEHVKRNQNKRADALANRAMDGK